MDVKKELLKIARQLEAFQKQALGEAEFWKIISLMNWPQAPNNTVMRKKLLLRTKSPIEIGEIRDMFDQCQSQLYRAFSSWVKQQRAIGNDTQIYSGDGFDDVTAHIIGLGRKEYAAALKNPALIKKRYDDDDYEESFAYCIPFVADYNDLTLTQTRERARKEYDNMDKLFSEREVVEDWSNHLHRLMEALKAIHSPYNVNYPEKVISEAKPVARNFVEKFPAWLSAHPEVGERLEKHGWKNTSWGVNNVIHDYLEWAFD